VKCTNNELNRYHITKKLPRSEKERKANRARLKRRKKRDNLVRRIIWGFIIFTVLAGAGIFALTRQTVNTNFAYAYSANDSTYGLGTKKVTLEFSDSFASNLCVASENVTTSGIVLEDALSSAIFDLNNRKILYSNNIYAKAYPASLTKLVTALVAVKYGNLDEIVTISANAVDLDYDSQSCSLEAGDTLTLNDLLHGLLIWSGNDAATAVAEHISGNAEDFVSLMNAEVQSLGATHSNFVNAHGLHDDNHYTTAYDMYLIFNECINNNTLLSILNNKSYVAAITKADSTQVNYTWPATNYYYTGETATPTNITIAGAKTGTTDEAGNCLILLSKDIYSNPYISIILNAETKASLYIQMTELLEYTNK